MTTVQRSKSHKKYSAGVLPIAWLGNQVMFLVGEDIRGSDDPLSPVSISDFGGKHEPSDRHCHEYTAAREFEEETLSMSISAKQMVARLQCSSIKLQGSTQNGHPYYMFVCSIPFSHSLPKYMKKMMNFLQSKGLGRMYIEKRNIMWLTLQQLETVGKRGVFARTLANNRDIIQRIGSCSPSEWEDLIEEHKKNID